MLRWNDSPDTTTESDSAPFPFMRAADAPKSLRGQTRTLAEEIAADAHDLDPEYSL